MQKISVIIPCYNAHDFIIKCLDSLLMQTFKDFEVIIVNDCSDDDTVQIANDWAEHHNLIVQVISNERNSGPSISRVKGAELSQSEWVAFCDSDDWYEPDFLEKMYDKAQRDRCELIFCGYRNVIGKKLDSHALTKEDLVLTPQKAMYLNVDSLCMALVKRKIFIGAPLLDIRYGEDMALVPILIQSANSVGVLNDVLYNYRIRQGSASLCPSNIMIDSLVKSFNYINTYLDNKYKFEKEYLGIRNLIYGSLLNLFKYSYDKKKANELINEFEEDFPFWGKSKTLMRLPLFKRIYVVCAKYRLYFIMYMLSHLHSIMLK